MSLHTRKELLKTIRLSYKKATRQQRIKMLEGFIAATGYERKYAISLLNKEVREKDSFCSVKSRPIIYNEEVQQCLLKVWYAANQICSKRLVPFMAEFVEKLEHHGHLIMSSQIKDRLLSMSAATVDRLLKPERMKTKRGITTTKPSKILRKQIPVRTFADWNEQKPGFMEADLVANCGQTTDGSFLNTLVLTDIASTWTECLPLLCKSQHEVIAAIHIAQSLLPFPLLGIDCDNGTEFMNYGLFKYCEEHNITLTRSRTYRKNDQAHVEEQNGSIVRKVIGYDRYEGKDAWNVLSELYAVLRMYINFFQPSMKLMSKQRTGARVSKNYDYAQTPYQRLITLFKLEENVKAVLKQNYDHLDPIRLLEQIEHLQNRFWLHAWKEDSKQNAVVTQRRYRSTPKPKQPRTWRTCPDAFEKVEERLRLHLEANPHHSAKYLLDILIEEEPQHFHIKQLRTLERRVAKWRKESIGLSTAQTGGGRAYHYLKQAKTVIKG